MDQICRLLVVNVTLLTILILGSTTIAQAQANLANDYRLNPVEGCFIKAIRNRSYVDVPIAKFSNAKINALPHPRRPQYFAFKSGGVIHLTPKKCLITWATPEDELEGLQDIEETEDFEKYERLNKAASENRILNSIELRDMKYFVQIRGGLPRMSDTESSISDTDYNLIAAQNSAVFINSSQVTPPKNGPNLGFEFGYKSINDFFWTFGINQFSSERKDRAEFDLATNEYEITDLVRTIYVGFKKPFYLNSSVAISTHLRAGISSGSQEVKNYEISNPSDFDIVKYESGSLVLNPEISIEVLVARNLAIGFNSGYSLHTKRKHVLEGEDTSGTTVKGYESNFNYSHAYLGLSLAYYFK